MMIRLFSLICLILYSYAWTGGPTRQSRPTPLHVSQKSNLEDEISIDKYHLTTKTNKELIFDEQAGRFFETSIRPGSFHQLWQEFLRTDENTEGKSENDQIATTGGFTNEMVPTRSLFRTSSTKYQMDAETDPDECLVHTPYQDTCDPVPLISYDEGTKRQQLIPSTIVEQCYAAWNARDMAGAAECFADFFEYLDSQYIGKMTNKRALIQHFDRQADLLPTGSRIVLDLIAQDSASGNIATQWHVEKKSGSAVPFTKGVSFYTLKNGLIASGFRVSEMLIKPSKNAVNGILSILPTSSRASSSRSEEKNVNNRDTDLSIIEHYFEAWNARDIDAAVDCFVDNCVYQTEDPVFVDKFEGKAALRHHLNKNAELLPSSCKIILDKIAVDEKNGNIGTQWHLDFNGMRVPNLQGCSMYTTDAGTGLLKTGFDVTEAPVKLLRETVPFLRAPAYAIFDL